MKIPSLVSSFFEKSPGSSISLVLWTFHRLVQYKDFWPKFVAGNSFWKALLDGCRFVTPCLLELENPSRSLRDLRVDPPSKVICKGDGTTHTSQKTAFKKDLETSLIQYIVYRPINSLLQLFIRNKTTNNSNYDINMISIYAVPTFK